MCMVQVNKMLPADELIIYLLNNLTLKLLHCMKLLHAYIVNTININYCCCMHDCVLLHACEVSYPECT